MTQTRKLAKREWHDYFDRVARGLGTREVQIEVAALNLGDQVAAEWIGMTNLSYDPKDDVLQVGTDHLLRDNYRTALRFLMNLEASASRTDADTYFKTMGRLRMAMAYDAMGRRELAEARYRQVLGMKEWGSSRERARRYLERPYEG